MSSEPLDYSSWPVDRLVGRVTELEEQLKRAQPNPKPQTTRHRPFDASRYSTRLIALKFAYLGQKYNGFEHHVKNKTPLPTIEEMLWKALTTTKLISPPSTTVDWTGCDYSKCGRTDKGVSAFGQVIGVRVRSNRPLEGDKCFDPIADELPYIQLLNRVLPPDIRTYAWCPTPAPDFSARFACRERQYKYFFTNPIFAPDPGVNGGDCWLDIDAMQAAAKRLEGKHDFRNFCKIDPAKQINNYRREIFSASVDRVSREPMSFWGDDEKDPVRTGPELYTFSVAGSAFLWHQVRCMVAVIFLVGQGLEDPSVITDLLNVDSTPSRPLYDMATDGPLVLWDCKFPATDDDHDRQDSLDWIYVGDVPGGSETPQKDAKFGPAGIMSDLWTLWRQRKIDQVLAGSLADVIALRGGRRTALESLVVSPLEKKTRSSSVRIFEGGNGPRFQASHVRIMDRERIEHFEIQNARHALRKGLIRDPIE